MPEAAGGFVGYAGEAKISDCYSTGAVARVMADGTRAYSTSKGFIGEASSSKVKNCYYQKDQGGETIINLSVTGVGVCEGLRCEDLQNGSLPEGFSADQWRAERGVYPMVKTMPVGRVTYRVDGGNGTVKVEGGLASGAEVACGVPLRISLQPQEGFMEDKLTANGAPVELTTNAYTWITQRGANDFVANFLTKRTIVLYSVDGEHGEIAIDGVGSGEEVAQGRVLVIALSPASGYEVDWLKCNGTPIAVDGNRAKWTAVDGRNRIVVKFREMPQVFYREEGGHGSIKVEGVQSGDHVATGTEVTITLAPDANYEVESLECNGEPIAVEGNRAKWTVAKGKNEIVVKFKELPVVLGTVEGGHGTIAFEGLSSGTHVNAGTEVTITLTPDDGYMVCWLKCNGKLVEVSGGKAVWTVVDGRNEIQARFIERGKAQVPMEGTGEPNSPYEIATLANLAWLSETPAVWDKHFKQVADIDASDTRHWSVSGGEAQGFKPIGTDDQPFTGYYDGGNHAIRGLFINRPGQNDVGLFGVCKNEKGGDVSLKDLRLEGVTVVGGNRVGGLAGAWWGEAKVSNCRVTVQSVAGEEWVGGFIGHIKYSKGMSGCSATPMATESSVRGKGAVGGFAGAFGSYSSISQCFSSLRVVCPSNDWHNWGGFVGRVDGDNSSKVSIEDCYSLGSVETKGDIPEAVGGFAGYAYEAKISRCYSTGAVARVMADGTRAYSTSKGFIGKTSSSEEVKNCYYQKDQGGETIINLSIAGVGVCEGLRCEDLQNGSLPKDFSANQWHAEKGVYPMLTSMATAELTHRVEGGHGRIVVEGGLESGKKVSVGTPLRVKLVPDAGYEGKDLSANGQLLEKVREGYVWIMAQGENSLVASFQEPHADVFYSVAEGEGEIAIEGVSQSGASVKVGQTLTVTLRPHSGYRVLELTLNGVPVDVANDKATITTVAGKNEVVVKFKELPRVFYSVAEGVGSISIDGVQSGDYVAMDTEVTITLTPGANYEVESLECNGTRIRVTDNRAKWTVEEGKNEIVVKFRELPRVFYREEGGHGSINVEGVQSGDPVAMGTKVTITLTPDANYEVGSLECNGEPIAVDGNRAKWTVVDGKNEIVVKFRELSRVFYSVAEGRGSISIDGVQSGDYVSAGTEVTITLTPAKNYMVWSLSCNGTLVSVNGNVATWRVVDGRNSIEARFKEGTFGFPESGDGSEGNPYLISTLENLAWISETPAVWGDYFRQTMDIDASDTRHWNVSGGEAEGFKPIGTEDQPFKGYYDGGNHAIRNLYINRPKQKYVGLFGVCENDNGGDVSLKDLWVEGTTVIGGSGVGGLAGAWYGFSKISNCHVTVQSVAGEEWVGGFMGYICCSKDVSGCSATPVAAESSVRGLRNVGGFASAFGNYASISQCFSSLRVVGIPRGAGWGCFVGAVYGDNSSNVSIKDCYSLGSVETEGDMPKGVGGFVGSSQFARINQCYATGALVGKSGGKYSSNQGFEGKNDGTSAVGCYFQNEQGNGMVSVTSLLGDGMSRAALQSGSLPRSFSSSVWSAVAGAYPVLRCVQNAQLSYGIVGNDGGEVVVGGGIQSGVTLSHGIPLQIAVMPRIGYTARVTINGISVVLKDGKATWITVRGSNEIVVAFTKTVVTYMVAEGRGTIEVDGVENGQSVSVGMRLRIHLRPERGYSVAELTCNAVPIPVQNNEATWTVVKGRNDIRVKFRDDSTPVESELLSGVFAEPNPTEGVVRLHGAERVLRCAVYSVMGRLMQSYTLRGEGEAAIDLTQYPSGMYLLRLEDANGGVRTLRVMRR